MLMVYVNVDTNVCIYVRFCNKGACVHAQTPEPHRLILPNPLLCKSQPPTKQYKTKSINPPKKETRRELHRASLPLLRPCGRLRHVRWGLGGRVRSATEGGTVRYMVYTDWAFPPHSNRYLCHGFMYRPHPDPKPKHTYIYIHTQHGRRPHLAMPLRLHAGGLPPLHGQGGRAERGGGGVGGDPTGTYISMLNMCICAYVCVHEGRLHVPKKHQRTKLSRVNKNNRASTAPPPARPGPKRPRSPRPNCGGIWRWCFWGTRGGRRGPS